MDSREQLIYLSIIHEGNWDSIMYAIDKKIYATQEELDKCLFEHTEDFMNAITILDSEYPAELKQSFKPPFVLFYRGNKKLLNSKNTICISGTRVPTDRAIESTKKCAYDYASQDYVLINSLANGINEIALNEYVNKGKQAIIVLASGFNNIYPITNKKLLESALDSGSLALTEYPSFVIPKQENFIARQRIIAYFSNGLIVSQMSKCSGTNILISMMSGTNKDVMCIPDTTNPDNYCNELIEEGATPVFKYCF